MINIEINIEKFPKSNADSYFEYDSEKHHKMIKELREVLLSVLEEDDKNQQHERINNNFCCNGSDKPCCHCCRFHSSQKKKSISIPY